MGGAKYAPHAWTCEEKGYGAFRFEDGAYA